MRHWREREFERHLSPSAQRYGMGVLTWGPLSAGWLSGRYTQGVDLESGGRTALERQKEKLGSRGSAD